MGENEDKNEFHIQEYECGQRTASYRMGNRHDRSSLSTIKRKSNTSLSSLFRAFFYPDNYPLGNQFVYIYKTYTY
jgi:hypothetical protein